MLLVDGHYSRNKNEVIDSIFVVIYVPCGIYYYFFFFLIFRCRRSFFLKYNWSTLVNCFAIYAICSILEREFWILLLLWLVFRNKNENNWFNLLLWYVRCDISMILFKIKHDASSSTLVNYFTNEIWYNSFDIRENFKFSLIDNLFSRSENKRIDSVICRYWKFVPCRIYYFFKRRRSFFKLKYDTIGWY